MDKFEVYPDEAGEYRWRLVAGNGEIVASSEGYVSQDNAVRGIRTLLEITGSVPTIEFVDA